MSRRLGLVAALLVAAGCDGDKAGDAATTPADSATGDTQPGTSTDDSGAGDSGGTSPGDSGGTMPAEDCSDANDPACNGAENEQPCLPDVDGDAGTIATFEGETHRFVEGPSRCTWTCGSGGAIPASCRSTTSSGSWSCGARASWPTTRTPSTQRA